MKFIKKYYINLLSFLLPIIILLIVCAINNLFPLGQNYLNIYDGNLQHTGFIEYFKNILLGNESLLYSFKGGLGYDFYSVFIYYLSDPLNIISVFFDREHLYVFYTILLFLKIGLCGFTCSILLKYFNKKDKYIILFSCIYALLSYNLLYYLNYMWFGSVIMLPLVVLGIEKLINERKKLLYFITLTLSILFNFYIGYMICIFSVIYFVYKYITLKKIKRDKKIIKDFIILSVLAGLVCPVFLIPVIFQLLNGKNTGFSQTNQTEYFLFSMDWFNAFYKITIGSFRSVDISYGSPNIYSSLFIVSLVLTVFFNTKISLKEKIVVGCILAFYLLSFSFNLIDYSWHMFQRPIWYPNRYSFTLSLFLIIIAYKSFDNIKSIKFNNWVVVALIYLMIMMVTSGIYNEIFENKGKILLLALSILLVIDYIFILFFKKDFKVLLIIFIVIELTLNSYVTIKAIPHNTSVNYFTNEIYYFNKQIKVLENSNNNFFRAEFNSVPTYNNGSLFDYNGVNFFSSIRNNKIMNFMGDNLGIKVSDGCSVAYKTYNPFNNAFLGIKYFDGNEKESYVKQVFKDGSYVYYNNLTNPLMYLVSNNIYNTKLDNKDNVTNYETIYDDVMNDETNIIDNNFKINTNDLTFKKYYVYNKVTYAKLTYTKNIEEDGWLSFYDMNEFLYYNPDIYINGKVIKDSSTRKTALFFKKGDKLKIVYDIASQRVKRTSLTPYFIKYNSLKNYVNKNNKNKATIVKYDKDNYIKSTIDVKKNNTLMTTIPYSKGWHVFVDGKEVKTKTIYNSLLSIDLKKGKHIIEFKYFPHGLIIGIIMSILALITSIFYIRKTKN